MQVRDFAWPKQTLLMSIRRGENTIIPHGDTVIHAGDTLVLLTDSQKRAQVRQQIEKLAAKLSTQEEKSGQE